MRETDTLYLAHMLEAAMEAGVISTGITRTTFDSDRVLRLALVHLLQIIGEAARKVSPEFKIANPRIDWKNIVSFRHRIVHDYMTIREDIVWEVLSDHLDPLIVELRKHVPPAPPEAPEF